MANNTCEMHSSKLAKISNEHQLQKVIEYIRSTDIMTDKAVLFAWTRHVVEVCLH